MANERHHAKFNADRSCCCQDMTIFRFSTRRLSDILDFYKYGVLTASMVRRASMHHRVKFRTHRSNRCQDMAVGPRFKMAAVRHLVFN